MDKYLYLIVNLASISIPFIAGFDRRLKFHFRWKYLFPAMILTMLVFIPWDMLKTRSGVWGFNPEYLTGFYIGNLPVEEWLFFITIPYSCLFTYHSLNYLLKKDYLKKTSGWIFPLTAFVLLATAILNFNKLYTSVTFISTAVFIIFVKYVVRPEYLGRFLMMYLVTLLPFFLVDGILTGSFIPGEIVYYDDTQNLGLRIGTIPVEDMVYGFMMLLMNVVWYEYLQRRRKPV